MALNSHTTRRLTTDNGVLFIHLGRYILESNWYLIALLAEALGDAVQQMRGGIVAHAWTVPAAVFHKIVEKKDK